MLCHFACCLDFDNSVCYAVIITRFAMLPLCSFLPCHLSLSLFLSFTFPALLSLTFSFPALLSLIFLFFPPYPCYLPFLGFSLQNEQVVLLFSHAQYTYRIRFIQSIEPAKVLFFFELTKYSMIFLYFIYFYLVIS